MRSASLVKSGPASWDTTVRLPRSISAKKGSTPNASTLRKRPLTRAEDPCGETGAAAGAAASAARAGSAGGARAARGGRHAFHNHRFSRPVERRRFCSGVPLALPLLPQPAYSDAYVCAGPGLAGHTGLACAPDGIDRRGSFQRRWRPPASGRSLFLKNPSPYRNCFPLWSWGLRANQPEGPRRPLRLS